ncbi:MAG: aminoacyl-histidine dipeptidase [Fusobacteriaceae bacterium]
MRVLENIEPKNVMKYFEDISGIPRESKKEKQISDWLVNFAKSKNLEVIQDKNLNVIIKKPATSGYENAPTVIIQGHMDMVCEKNQGNEHDFSKEGIKLRIEGDYIKGAGTTLGADNGIAVAFALALLDSDIPHPNLEVLITADEEAGMSGAAGLDGKLLSGKIMINLDAEENMYVSCAGGARGEMEIPVKYISTQESSATVIQIRGLQGGHSGANIHDQRGNSNKLLGRLLNEIRKELKFNICEIFGGAKDNAIPREAEAVLIFEQKNDETQENIQKKLDKIIAKTETTYKDEFRISDPNICIKKESKILANKKVMDDESTDKIIDAIILHPNGINTWSKEINNLVESSLNLGVVEQKEKSVVLRSAIRGSVLTRKFEIIDQLRNLAKVLGVKFSDSSHYPAWEYKPESKLRDVFSAVHEKLFGEKMKIEAVHAGLECGIISEKIPNIDIVAFGPVNHGAHTPEERLSISSTQKMWKLFVDGIKELKNY